MDIIVILIILGFFIGLVIKISDYIKDGNAKVKLEQMEKLRNAIRPHAGELSRKKTQLTRSAGYGLEDSTSWIKEQERFVNLILLPLVYGRFLVTFHELSAIIEIEIDLYREQHAGQFEVVDESWDGVRYETYCAELLRQQGFSAHLTKMSGDQGADIVAKIEGITIVIQCKRYGKPVGNNAVQEVAAAKAHYGANYASVIASSSFTPSAIELAASNNVILLHHEQILDLRSIIGTSSHFA